MSTDSPPRDVRAVEEFEETHRGPVTSYVHADQNTTPSADWFARGG